MQLKSKSEINECQVELEIEIGMDEVSGAVEQAYDQLASVTNIPGFRKGKAPKAILARYIPMERVRERVADVLLPGAVTDAFKEAGIEPYGQPNLEVVQFELDAPIIFKAGVALAPKVELGNYKGLEVERTTPVVTDEQVQEKIDALRERTAVYQYVEGRPVQKGDRATVQMVDANADSSEKAPDLHPLIVGENLPSFDEALVGMNIGDEKSIDVVYPEDFPEERLAGNTEAISTKVLGLEEKKLPEENDEWAKSVGTSLGTPLETLEQLRTRLRDELEKSANKIADQQTESKIITSILENSKVCYPKTMLDQETKARLEGIQKDFEQVGMKLEDYLARTKKTEEQVVEEIEKVADQSIKVMLLISEIAEKEDIKIDEETFQQEIKRIAEERGVPSESLRAYIDKMGGSEDIKEHLIRRKVLEFLVQTSNIKNMEQSS